MSFLDVTLYNPLYFSIITMCFLEQRYNTTMNPMHIPYKTSNLPFSPSTNNDPIASTASNFHYCPLWWMQTLFDDLNDSWSKWYSFHPVLLLQFCSNDTKHTGTKRFFLVVEKNTSIVVKSDISSVRSCHLLFGTNNQGMSNITFLDLLCSSLTTKVWVDRSCSFDNTYNLVT